MTGCYVKHFCCNFFFRSMELLTLLQSQLPFAEYNFLCSVLVSFKKGHISQTLCDIFIKSILIYRHDLLLKYQEVVKFESCLNDPFVNELLSGKMTRNSTHEKNASLDEFESFLCDFMEGSEDGKHFSVYGSINEKSRYDVKREGIDSLICFEGEIDPQSVELFKKFRKN